MRILVYSPLSLSFGGGFERWILEVAKRVQARGHTITVACTKSLAGRAARETSIRRPEDARSFVYFELDYIPVVSRRGSPLPLPGLHSLKVLAREADILYFNNAYFLQPALIWTLGRESKIPVVSGHHSAQKAVPSYFTNSFQAFHTINREQDALLRARYGDRVHYIPNGVDSSLFVPRAPTAGTENFQALFVGRLENQKGIATLESLVEEANRDRMMSGHIEFTIVGEGDLRSRVQNLQTRHRYVAYLGTVPDNVLVSLLQRSDVLLVPSLRETFSLITLEAQACGLPVIASKIPGPEDIVLDGRTGWLVEPTAQAFARALRRAYELWLNARGDAMAMRKSARERATQFDWGRIVDRLETMLERVAS